MLVPMILRKIPIIPNCTENFLYIDIIRHEYEEYKFFDTENLN